MSLQNYVISLPNAQERRLYIQQEFEKHNISFNFFDAAAPGENLNKLMQESAPALALSLFSPGEKACFMSHVLLWQKCVDENLPYIGVFEDDITLGRDAHLFLSQDYWLKERFNGNFIIKCETYLMDVTLQETSIKPIKTHHQLSNEHQDIIYRFPELSSIHYGTAGYIISQDAAKHLLKLVKTLPLNKVTPIDHIMFEGHDLAPSVTVYQLSPAICVQQDCLQPSLKGSVLGSGLENERNEYRLLREHKTSTQSQKPVNKQSIPAIKRLLLRKTRALYSILKKKTLRRQLTWSTISFISPIHSFRAENHTKISIIIPIYNAEKYLSECLESIITQTLTDIEIICINDGSSDNSASILDDYARKDSRIKVIHKSSNEGTLLARKAGMLVARGQYTTFIDPDDYYTTNRSLETIYNQIVLESVDILMFGVEVFKNNLTADEKKGWEKALFCQESFDGTKNILQGIVDSKYNWMLANKIFLTEICHRACAHIKDTYLIMAEDLYIYSLIAYYAKSFRGMTKDTIYSYRLGVGISTSQVGLQRYQHDIMAIQVVTQALDEFFSQTSYNTPKYQKVIDGIKTKLNLTLARNFLVLPKQTQIEALSMIVSSLNIHQLKSLIKDTAPHIIKYCITKTQRLLFKATNKI